MPEVLKLHHIRKRFGATQALDGVNLAVSAGEVHALIGENGAGKSTLMKILSGAVRADEGLIELQGKRCDIHSPAAARSLGIAMIYQELTLAPHLTAEENLTLGIERHHCGILLSQRPRIHEVLEMLGHADLPLSIPVRRLSIGLQQVVEIARALMLDSKLLIMDEPTSSLSSEDTRALFQIIARLRQSGMGIIYISHFLEEVLEIADRYTVLRDGRIAGTGDIQDTNAAHLVSLMVGRNLSEMFPREPRTLGDPVLRVEAVQGRRLPKSASFTVRRGEIFGIAGLVGAGRSETLRTVFGLERAVTGTLARRDGGSVRLRTWTPTRALAYGLDLLSENRKDEGLAIRMGVAANITLSTVGRLATANGRGLLRLRQERQHAVDRIKELNIRCQDPRQPVMALSGGNQQKVALARLLERGSDVLLLDEPTRGIDVGSKVDIYRLMNQLAASGKALLFVSSYLPELFGMCDTLAVMHRGTLSAAKPIHEWTEHEVMQVATAGTVA